MKQLTTELRFPYIKKEFDGEIEPPTFEDIINLIPEYKRIVISA